jgi:hypothetical protein
VTKHRNWPSMYYQQQMAAGTSPLPTLAYQLFWTPDHVSCYADQPESIRNGWAWASDAARIEVPWLVTHGAIFPQGAVSRRRMQWNTRNNAWVIFPAYIVACLFTCMRTEQGVERDGLPNLTLEIVVCESWEDSASLSFIAGFTSLLGLGVLIICADRDLENISHLY